MAGKRRRVIALEIGTQWLKRMVVEREGGELAIRQLDVIELPPSVENRAWASRLQEGLDVLSSKTEEPEYPHASIDLQQVTTRYFLIPRTSDEVVRKAVAAEVETEIPLPVDQLVWDYRVMNGRADAGGQMDVFVAGIRRDLVTKLTGQLSAKGIQPRSIGVSSLAAFSGYQASSLAGESGTVALVDAGYSRTSITIGSADTVFYTRSIVAPSPEDPSYAETLSQELQRTASFLERSHKRSPHVERVFVCGRGSGNKELLAELTERLGMPVSQYDPLSPLTLAPSVSLSDDERSGLAVCVGTALTALDAEASDINLLPQEMLPKLRGERWEGLLSPGSIAVGVSVLLILLIGALLYLKPVIQASLLDRKLSQDPYLEEEVRYLERERTALETIRDERVRWTRVLRELADIIPQHIVVIDFEFVDPSQVVVNLKLGNPSQAPEMAKVFDESPLFENARYGNIEFDNQGCRTKITAALAPLSPGEYEKLKEGGKEEKKSEANPEQPGEQAPEPPSSPTENKPPEEKRSRKREKRKEAEEKPTSAPESAPVVPDEAKRDEKMRRARERAAKMRANGRIRSVVVPPSGEGAVIVNGVPGAVIINSDGAEMRMDIPAEGGSE